jgi:hypothetical protein
VKPWVENNGYPAMGKEVSEAFGRADFPEVVRAIDQHFGNMRYSLKGLFRDEQRKILDQILTSTREELFSAYRLISDRHMPLMRFLADLGAPPPNGIVAAMEFVLNQELIHQFQAETADPQRVHSLLAEIHTAKIPLEQDKLAYVIKQHLDRLAERWQEKPEDLPALQRMESPSSLVQAVAIGVNLWKPQNAYFKIFGSAFPEMQRKAHQGDEIAKRWLEHFSALGEKLGFVSPFAFPSP